MVIWSINEEKLLKITSNNIIELINHSSDSEWKYKYIAYITVAEIVGHIEELSIIGKLINILYFFYFIYLY